MGTADHHLIERNAVGGAHPTKLTMGQVIGETDSRAERSINGTISFQNVMSTIYHTLGIDPETKLPDFNGRP